MSELRKDPVLGRWVIVGTERVYRPADLRLPPVAPRPGPCVFCPGREHETPPPLLAYRDGDTGDDAPWRVRVVPNKFPALRVEGDLGRRGDGVYDLMHGIGAHEIVVESRGHDDDLSGMADDQLERVLAAYRERMIDLGRDERLRVVTVLRSRGRAAGAHVDHPHAQLVASPVLPMRLATKLLQARAYHDYRERCLFCDILHQEVDQRQRIVVEGEHMVAFAPFAAAEAYATWVLPRRHAATFDATHDAERRDMARVLRAVLRRLDNALGRPPYRMQLRSAPFGDRDSPSFHWHLELAPRVRAVVGFDSGGGLPVNPVPPEDAARALRETPE